MPYIPKKHYVDEGPHRVTYCGTITASGTAKLTEKKKKVTCAHCQRILVGEKPKLAKHYDAKLAKLKR